MTKTYNFKYEVGKYILVYNNPGSKDEPFSIDSISMEFNTQYFYKYVFQDVTERLTLNIVNNLEETEMEPLAYKKGIRVYKIIVDLCKKITDEINVQCFDN